MHFIPALFCYGDEENAQRACTNEHLTTAEQSGISKDRNRFFL